jgi:hypothetical protein
MLCRPALAHIVRAAAFGVALLLSLVSSLYQPLFAQSAGAQIQALSYKAIVFIAVRTQTPQGVSCRSGTGFVISSDGYVITAWHLLTDKSGAFLVNPVIRGNISDPFDCKDPVGDIRPLELVSANRDQDVALLKIRSDKGPYDYVTVCRETIVNGGSTLWAIGFPLGQPLSPIQTTLGNRNGPRGFWQITNAIDAGMSGGPVFNETGRLAGIVWGDVDEARSLGFVVPVQHVMDLFMAAGVRTDYCKTTTGLDVAQGCVPVFVDYPIDIMKDDHATTSAEAKPYQIQFHARVGHKIKTFEWRPLSSNNASEVDISLADDHERLSVGFRVTSGPFFDRWRGWVSGRISTIQLPEACF